MFGLLKRKLKDAISKISKKVEKKGEERRREEKVEKKIEKLEPEERKGKEKRKEGIVKKIKKRVSKEIEIAEEDIKDILWNVQLSLLEADVAYEATEKICEGVKRELIGKKVKKGEIERAVKRAFQDAMLKILTRPAEIDIFSLCEKKKPFVIVFLGFNGSGKTTTIAKIAKLFLERGKKVVFAAGDTFRAASIEQLEEHGKALGVRVIKHRYGADPAAVVYDAIKHAKARGIDVVLADTAGRAHTNAALMEELKKICRVNKPDLKILVMDSLTGNDVVEQAKMFDREIGVDCMVMTKVDVYEKGGSIISAAYAINKPVLFLGYGQGYDEIKPFNPEEFVKNLLE